MTEIQIAWLELMTVGGLGVILVLLGVTSVSYTHLDVYKRQIKKDAVRGL